MSENNYAGDLRDSREGAEASLQRKLPFSLLAEQSLLGSVLVDPEAFNLIADMVSVTDFYLEEHQQIFSAMHELFLTSKDIDVSAAGVKLNNVPAGYTAKVTALNSDSVTIIGPKSAIRGLKAKNVMLSCDLTAKKGESIKTGTRQLPLTVSIAKADGTWAYGTYQATVELSKK